jgi:hypothetical protein
VLSLLEITTEEPPPMWQRLRWRYSRAVLLSSAPAGRTVAGWLARGRIPLPSGSVALGLDGSFTVERRDSRFEGLYETLPWPTRERILRVTDPPRHPPHDELVTGDGPAFINFDHAAAAFFGVPLVPNRNFSGHEVVLRQQDRRARIESVVVRSTAVEVGVSGRRLRGTTLALSGPDGARKTLSGGSRMVRLPTPTGLGTGAWLALHKDDELLDRRILDPEWGGRNFDVEVEASTGIQALISGGEGASVEFKSQLPKSDPSGVMKTIAAFANGGGGTVLFGVDDEGLVLGLGADSTSGAVDRLTNMVSDWVRPLPDFDVETVAIAGRAVLAVRVPPGAHAPYGVGTTDRDIRYYVRRGGTTFPATPADVRAFVQAWLPASERPWFPPGRRL